ncbi:uncharacterized protein LOC106090809 [Stomoxys calcitrans]|uniref:uncharacterized protein LOC106090809 n=1 Tax=Stomoxys calcitrans TaxID=35570 RepID=UPI0027E278D4|nr:uncharacterized protein LOC106090809 [Stomoxys calcitrans]
MSNSLNVLCAICSEYFSSCAIIYCTTKCGHVFHQQCLTRWLSHSDSCPQCRRKCHRHMVHRVYLNFSEPLPADDLESEAVKSFDWFPFDNNMTAEKISKFGLKLDDDEDGDAIYAAHVYLHNDLLPAFYVPKKKGVYCAWNCQSHFLEDEIELLDVSNDSEVEYKWVAAANGEIPEHALAFGYSDTGESLYCGRALVEGRIRYGKLHPSHSCCYVPFERFEKNNNIYEVLVRVPKKENST